LRERGTRNNLYGSELREEGRQVKLYFEDLEKGDVFRGDACVADKEEMLDYARKNDPSPFHLDEEAASNSPFDGLIVSGGYTVTLWYRSAIPILASIAFLGGFEWHIKLPLPVRPGDRVRTEVEILGKKPSSKPGRGYVTVLHKIFNQDSQLVFTCEVVWMIATRPPPHP
jgi:acyl dehydratase